MPKRNSKKKRARVSTVSRDTTPSERTFYGALIAELAQARRRLSMTQEQLDHVLGVSPGMVAKWESFARMPGGFMLACWCNALDVDLTIVHRKRIADLTYATIIEGQTDEEPNPRPPPT